MSWGDFLIQFKEGIDARQQGLRKLIGLFYKDRFLLIEFGKGD